MKTLQIILAATLLAAPTLHGQIVADGTTNTLSNVTTNITGDVTVGTNVAFTLLILSDNVLLTNSVNGVISLNATAKSNEVRLISATARWRMGNTLYVGSNGSFSTLVVSNGALVENADGTLGNRIDSSNNFALVTGVGSIWSNRSDLRVGSGGRGNQLIVSNGGWVAGGSGFVGNNASGSNNLALVTGSGSVWSNTINLTVGLNGPGNRLVVEAGGQVHCDAGAVGSFGSASNNEALVTGSGSFWTNRSSLTIGSQGSRNRLVVSNAASVWSQTGFMGGNSASNNQVVVTGAGSVWSNQTDFFLAGGGNRVDVKDGGAIVTGNSTIDSSANSSMLVLTDSGSVWNSQGSLIVGQASSGSVLIASNGATVLSSNATIGVNGSTANNNLALLTGAGTLWSNRSRLTVGNFSFGNQVVISNGAIYVGTGTAIGANASASSNSAVIAGAQTRWTNSSIFYVGSNGPANHLLISDGGLVKSFGGTLGGSATSTNNEAVVTGPGSLWLPSNLLIGSSGDFRHGGNRLVISDGGSVISQFSAIGDNSSNNEVVVTGPGSVWTETDRVFLGYGQGRNRLVITNGGEFFSQGIIVGGDTALSTNNRVIVDGGTLQVTNGTLPATTLGAGVLDIRHGTNVLNAGLIDVDKLLLTNTLGLFEFNGGTLITRGGFITNAPFVVGRSGTTPAVWDVRAGVSDHFLSSDLQVGINGAANQLTVSNGGVVRARVSDVGIVATSSNNVAVVTGPGSLLSNSFELVFGFGSAGNQLVISNGGMVLNGVGYLGNDAASSNNLAVVTDPGSVWSNGSVLNVGYAGASGNQLRISNGGQVVDSDGIVGFSASSRTNSVLVTGNGSTWNNLANLTVGNSGSGNALIASNGATVLSSSAVIGASTTSTNNRVLVDGGTLRATNAAGTGVLDIRRGTNVLNAGLVEVDRLLVTNTQGYFEFSGGTASAKSSLITNGQGLRVGNGVSPATFVLAGNGSHFFDSVLVFANGTLTGNGMVGAPPANSFAVLDGGLLSPGASIGKIVFTNRLYLFGKVLMEISKNGVVVTNDQIQAMGGIDYGGALIVTNIGPTAPASGDKFKLFNAPFFTDSFQSITLPPLGPGLNWTNKLLVDGSIEVFALPAIPISTGSYTQNFDSLSMSGTNNPWRDSFTLPGWYAAKTVSPTTITNYRASDGSEPNGALYSFGSTGSSERALGSIASESVGIISYGLCFTNDTTGRVGNFVITYTGEQWRNGDSAVTNTLTFWYRVSASALTNPEPGTVTNWTQVTNLDFVSPTVLTNATALDGNQATNRQTFSTVLVSGLVVPPGQNVFFRWHDLNDSGADQGIAVDDLVVAFSPLPPQITSIGLTTNGFLKIVGLGGANAVFGIEAATNLSPPISWQLIVTNTADGAGLFQFTDTNAPFFPRRFYRALFP